GRQRAGAGQRVYRAAVVEREVRIRVSARSSDGAVPASGIGELPGVLQSGTSASEPGVSHTVGRVPRRPGRRGSLGQDVRTVDRVAAGGGRGSAPSRCARLRCAAAPTGKQESLATASLSKK